MLRVLSIRCRELLRPDSFQGGLTNRSVQIAKGSLNVTRCTVLQLHSRVIAVDIHVNHWQCSSFKSQCSAICTNAQLCKNLFVQSENSFAHDVLEKNPLYASTLVQHTVGNEDIIKKEEFQDIINKDWMNECPDNVYNAFDRVSRYCSQNSHCITEVQFDNLCEALKVKCRELPDSYLIGVLANLTKWPQSESINSRNFGTLWSAIDKECVVRVRQWDFNKLLLVADHWFKLYLSSVSKYMWQCNLKLGRKPNRLSPQQLVQCMFYINVYRKIHPEISMFEFEYSLEQCVDKLSIDEIAILAMGFFKSMKKIRSETLLLKMIERTSNEVDTIQDIPLSAILKVVRYSLPPSLKDKLYDLLDRLDPSIDQFSLMTCIHIALVGSQMMVFHEGILKKISQRYSENIKDVRIKDIERLVFVLTLFNYNPKTEPCIFDVIVKELQGDERKEELAQYPKCVVRCLHYLTMGNIYLKDNISTVLHPIYITHTYGKNNFYVEHAILALDASVEIECPHYDGNRLDPKLRLFMTKKYIRWIPDDIRKKVSATDRLLVEVIAACEGVLRGKQNFYAGHVLPHFERADIVFCLGPDGTPLPIPESLTTAEVSAVKRPPPTPEDGKWYSLVIGGINNYISDSDQVLGFLSTKLYHLQLIGYTPIMIPWYEWRKVDIYGREDYLRSKIPNIRSAW